MEVAMGRVAPEDAWGDQHRLRHRLETLPLPPQLWLASSGPPSAARKLTPMQERVQAAGYRCTDRSGASAMCSCCSHLGPWPLRPEVLGCAGWTGQQQRSAGLGIHHQLQQGLRR